MARAVRVLDRLLLGPADPARRASGRGKVLQGAPVRFWFFNPLAWVALAGLTAYRRWVPDSAKRPCRFQPSCSRYMSAAIVKYGVGNGMRRGMLRIHRCIGFGGSGYDPP